MHGQSILLDGDAEYGTRKVSFWTVHLAPLMRWGENPFATEGLRRVGLLFRGLGHSFALRVKANRKDRPLACSGEATLGELGTR